MLFYVSLYIFGKSPLGLFLRDQVAWTTSSEASSYHCWW